jgi:hypothetical protein
MNKHTSIFLFSVLVALTVGAEVLAQNAAIPPPPEPVLAPGVSLPPSGQPVLQTSGPSATLRPAATPQPAPQLYQQPNPYALPSDQPATVAPETVVVAPAYVVPGRRVFVEPEPWLPPPSSSLGLIPGSTGAKWDFSLDALWLAMDAGKGVELGYTSYNYFPPPPHTVRPDSLWSNDEYFPLEPGVRFQLMGQLTDSMAVEATCFGLQQWSVGRTIYGDPVHDAVWAHTPWLNTSDNLGGLNDYLSYSYDSRVASVEINQRFKLSSYSPYRAFSWLWGVRYFFLSTDFNLRGYDWYYNDYESLTWQTKNNLIGPQLGFQWTWGWDRLQLSSEIKGGLFANAYSQRGIDTVSGTSGAQPFDISRSGTGLSAMFELSLMLRCRITECLWFRAGYQFYCVTGLALGPRQLDGYDAGGTVGLDGLSIGLEWTR